MIAQKAQRLHARVTGRVQGVGFRSFVQSQATQLGLTGWVRNRWDGSVEVIAEGPQEELESLLQALYRGPRSGTTKDVRADWQTAAGDFTTFNIRRTG